jgi:glycosyltransferase involved in cell wall biosynthesis
VTEGPLVGVGVPVWQASAFVARTLQSVLDQKNVRLQLVVSVDGADADSAAACRPFASDPRVRLVVQPKRLGWVANTAVVLAAASQGAEFACVQPHDDWIEPDYLATLVEAAHEHPRAAVVFTDLAAFGAVDNALSQDSVVGSPMGRQLTLLTWHYNAVAFRGLTRTSALRAVPSISGNRHTDFACDTVWMARLARVGDLVRVPRVLYHKWYGPTTAHATWTGWPAPQKLAAWRLHCLDMLAEALTVATNARDRERLTGAARRRLVLADTPLGPYVRDIQALTPFHRWKLQALFGAEAAVRTDIGPLRHWSRDGMVRGMERLRTAIGRRLGT